MSTELTRQQWDNKRRMLTDSIKRCGGTAMPMETEALMNSWFGKRPAEPRPTPLRMQDAYGYETMVSVDGDGDIEFLRQEDGENVDVKFENIDAVIEFLKIAQDWKIKNG